MQGLLLVGFALGVVGRIDLNPQAISAFSTATESRDSSGFSVPFLPIESRQALSPATLSIPMAFVPTFCLLKNTLFGGLVEGERVLSALLSHARTRPLDSERLSALK